MTAETKHKQKYKVTINWSGQLLEYFTRAFNEEQAKRNVRVTVAKNLGYTNYYIRQRLTNFDIKKVTDC